MVNVVIGIVEKNDKILLIQRERRDFIGLWGIPGGKVEECDKLFIKDFYIDKSKNYLKLDCYKDDNDNYYWE